MRKILTCAAVWGMMAIHGLAGEKAGEPPALPAFALEADAAGTDVPFTAGLVLPDGAPKELVTTLPDTQVVTVNTYPSGSPRRVMIHGRAASVAAGQKVTGQLKAGKPGAGVGTAGLTPKFKERIALRFVERYSSHSGSKTYDPGLAVVSGQSGKGVGPGGVIRIFNSYSKEAGELVIPKDRPYFFWLGDSYLGTNNRGPYRVEQGADASQIKFVDGCPLDFSGGLKPKWLAVKQDDAVVTLAQADHTEVLADGPEAVLVRFWQSAPVAGTQLRPEWFVRWHANGNAEVTARIHNGAIDRGGQNVECFIASLEIDGAARVSWMEWKSSDKEQTSKVTVLYPFERPLHMGWHLVDPKPILRPIVDEAQWKAVNVVPPINRQWILGLDSRHQPGKNVPEYVPGWVERDWDDEPNKGGWRFGWTTLSPFDQLYLVHGTVDTWRMLVRAVHGCKTQPTVFRLAATGARPDLTAAPWKTTALFPFGGVDNDVSVKPPCGGADTLGSRYPISSSYPYPVDFPHTAYPGMFLGLVTGRPEFEEPADYLLAAHLSCSASLRGQEKCYWATYVCQDRGIGRAIGGVAQAMMLLPDGAERNRWKAVLLENMRVRIQGVPENKLGFVPVNKPWGAEGTPKDVGYGDGLAVGQSGGQTFFSAWMWSYIVWHGGWAMKQKLLSDAEKGDFESYVTRVAKVIVALHGDGVTGPSYLHNCPHSYWRMTKKNTDAPEFILRIGSHAQGGFYPKPETVWDSWEDFWKGNSLGRTGATDLSAIKPEGQIVDTWYLYFANVTSKWCGIPGADAAVARMKADPKFEEQRRGLAGARHCFWPMMMDY